MLNAGVLLVRVLSRVLESGVLGHAGGDGLGDELLHAVGVFPGDVSEVLVEDPDNAGQPVQLGLWAVSAAGGGYGVDLGVLVGGD